MLRGLNHRCQAEMGGWHRVTQAMDTPCPRSIHGVLLVSLLQPIFTPAGEAMRECSLITGWLILPPKPVLHSRRPRVSACVQRAELGRLPSTEGRRSRSPSWAPVGPCHPLQLRCPGGLEASFLGVLITDKGCPLVPIGLLCPFLS